MSKRQQRMSVSRSETLTIPELEQSKPAVLNTYCICTPASCLRRNRKRLPPNGLIKRASEHTACLQGSMATRLRLSTSVTRAESAEVSCRVGPSHSL